MEILVHPADLLRCSLAARGALLLGDPARVPFPGREAISRLPEPARMRIEERVAWIRAFVSVGACVVDAVPDGGWDAAVISGMELAANPMLGPALWASREPPDPHSVSDQLAMGLSREPVGSLTRLSIDQLLDRSAPPPLTAIARDMGSSRVQRLERTMTREAARFQILLPSDAEPEAVLAVRQAVPELIAEAGDLIAEVTRQHDSEQARSRFAEVLGLLRERVTEACRQRTADGFLVVSSIPTNISVRAAEAALIATTGARHKPGAQLAATSTEESICLQFKPLGGSR